MDIGRQSNDALRDACALIPRIQRHDPEIIAGGGRRLANQQMARYGKRLRSLLGAPDWHAFVEVETDDVPVGAHEIRLAAGWVDHDAGAKLKTGHGYLTLCM